MEHESTHDQGRPGLPRRLLRGAGRLPRRGVDSLRYLLRRPLLLAAVLVLAVAAGALGYQVFKRPPDVKRGEDVAFIAESGGENPAGARRRKARQPVDWPMFGFDRARTRHLPARGVTPPFKRLWRYSDEPLLEFPPIYVKGVLYLIDNDGRVFAFDADTGRRIWQRKIAELNASAPAYSEGRLYIANLSPGQLISLNAKNGRTVWTKELPSRTESSPVVVGNRLFFGAENGNLYALDKRNGRTLWSTSLAGEIKAAPAYHEGTLYVGDYGGEMSAVRARDGQIVWQAGAQGLSFSRTGSFYSTPAVEFGRVYSGNNDGRIYSFVASTGELAWTRSTGGWVYSGPAVARTKTSPPTVYIGSFDGNVYALDAETGDTRWSRSAGGPVIGSLVVIGNIVYVASFEPKQTRGFAVGSGKQVFKYHTGAYTPVISDGRRIYLTGYSSIHALEPIGRRELRRRAAREKARELEAQRRRRRLTRARAERRRRQARVRAVRQRRQARDRAEQRRQGRARALRKRRQARARTLRQRRAARAQSRRARAARD